MKKRTFKIIFVFISILAVLLLIISIGINGEKNSVKNDTQQKIAYYTVAEYQGKVAVFKNSESIPFEIYDSYVETLPEHDRELLKNGIKADNTDELQKIIEDYTS